MKKCISNEYLTYLKEKKHIKNVRVRNEIGITIEESDITKKENRIMLEEKYRKFEILDEEYYQEGICKFIINFNGWGKSDHIMKVKDLLKIINMNDVCQIAIYSFDSINNAFGCKVMYPDEEDFDIKPYLEEKVSSLYLARSIIPSIKSDYGICIEIKINR